MTSVSEANGNGEPFKIPRRRVKRASLDINGVSGVEQRVTRSLSRRASELCALLTGKLVHRRSQLNKTCELLRRKSQFIQTASHFGTKAFDQCSTSDYGTASEDSCNCSSSSYNCKSPVSDSQPCRYEDALGDVEALASDDEGFSSDCESVGSLTNVGWESDEDNAPKGDSWDADAEQEYYRHLRESGNARLLHSPSGEVHAIIPSVTPSGIMFGDFKVNTLESEMYKPRVGLRLHHVSSVVSMEPHGIRFFESFPAFIFIPVYVEPEHKNHLVCLTSNTAEGSPPNWERLPHKSFRYNEGQVVVVTNHFSLFTVILEEPYPEVIKRIRSRIGGYMRIDGVPGVEVFFPRKCLQEDIMAYLRVLYDSETSLESGPGRPQGALASPIVMLGPHGYVFNQEGPPVLVTLPIPNYEEIKRNFGGEVQLTVWQSSTAEDESLVWEMLNVSLEVKFHHNSSYATITFPVRHFSFFKAVWELLASSLYEAKMGVSYFYPYISFSMMCQAFMEEDLDTNRFGLEVIFYRSDKRLPETTNYRHRVGASLKPKLVRPGRILVRLRSQMFEADVDAGEEPEMAKEEPDFRGRDFEKQYACRFKPTGKVDRGTFGKVIVERVVTSARNDLIFEFNLHKSGCEGKESTTMDISDRWSVVAIKELAGTLQIVEDSNWRKFAQYIGFTKNEIKSKLQYAADPFVAMINLYQGRGGTPEEFVQALYAVSRDLHLGTGSSKGSGSSRHSSSEDSSNRSTPKSKSKPLHGRWWGLPWRAGGNDSDSGAGCSKEAEETQTRKRPLSSAEKGSGGSSAKKKKLKFSDVSETVSSSSDEESKDDGDEGDDEEEGEKHSKKGKKALSDRSTEKYKNNQTKLSDGDLWDLSAHMNGMNWRALGRSLGLEESVVVNIEVTYKANGLRECAYQMLLEWKGRMPRKCNFGTLYSALMKEKMASVAKHMAQMFANKE